MNLEDDFFDFESSSLEDFSEMNEMPIRNHITIVWHEMGHFIGNKIAFKNGFDTGEVTAINFGSPARIYSTSIYTPLGKTATCEDYYGLLNKCFQDTDDISRITAAVKDKKKTLSYILYLLCGGFLNIYIINEEPTEQDFEDCYHDSLEDEDNEGFLARAGNDWSKVRRLAQIDKWDLNTLKEFRTHLYLLFHDFKVFSGFKDLLNDIDTRFNGKRIEGLVLEMVGNEVEDCLEKIDPEFWVQLDNLFSEYSIKL